MAAGVEGRIWSVTDIAALLDWPTFIGMECSCCGQEREVVALMCHDDVKVCRQCIGWLRDNSGMVTTTPIFPVSDLATSVAFYDLVGFETGTWDGGGFGFVTIDGESVVDLDQGAQEVPSGFGCFVTVPDVAAWHGRITAAGIAASELEEMPWGMNEFRFSDPDGNYIRMGQPVPSGNSN